MDSHSSLFAAMNRTDSEKSIGPGERYDLKAYSNNQYFPQVNKGLSD